MTEQQYDRKLKITTVGRDAYKEDENHHPYEPTPYSVLERLVESEYVTRENVFVDYGCGKGRVDFFLSERVGCQTIGIEYDSRIYKEAMENCKHFVGMHYPMFECTAAEDYHVGEADCFYFFNPFTVKILESVLGKILESYYENPRKMTLFFYYPDDEYLAYLMSKEELTFTDEIDCADLFEGNNHRERILIFETMTIV